MPQSPPSRMASLLSRKYSYNIQINTILIAAFCRFNPGRLDPTNTAWTSSRKPLVAAWQTTTGSRFYTIDLHDTAKSDASSSVQGNIRPPINSDVEKRTAQVAVIAVRVTCILLVSGAISEIWHQNFVNSVLALDPNAPIIVAGDFNEFVQTRSVYAPFTGILTEVDVLANVPIVERYTYVFDHQNEQLDHIFVSNAIGSKLVEVEHIHVNNWLQTFNSRTSDHDPSVARLRIC